MHSRLTRGEYWLLESAVEYAPQLRDLTRPNLGEILNKDPHGITRENLVADLTRLFSDGLMVCNFLDGPPFTPTLAQIHDALDERRGLEYCTWYRLTSAGGAVWEHFAKPNWTWFVEEHQDSNAENVAEYRCSDLRHLQLYFNSLDFCRAGVSCAPSQASLTLEWDEIGPWQATYWKRFPHAHRVRAWLPSGSHFSSGVLVSQLKRYWYRWGS